MSLRATALAPIQHTVLSPEAIARIAVDRFAFGPSTSCRLYRTYVNDVYRLETTTGVYAVKLARHGWRSVSDAGREGAILQHLRRSGIVVPEPIPSTTGDLAIGLQTPEGERALSVHRWLPGRKPQLAFDRQRVGASLAQLHVSLSPLAPTPDDRCWDMTTLVEDSVKTIAGVATDADRQIMLAARASILSTVAQWGEGSSMTYCHGDATLDNLIIDGDKIGFFDFDLSGWSWRVFDLVSLAGWAMMDPAQAGPLWTALRDGYTTISPLSEADERLLPAVVVAHALWEIAHDIRCSAVWFGDWMLPDPARFQRIAHLCDIAFPNGTLQDRL